MSSSNFASCSGTTVSRQLVDGILAAAVAAGVANRRSATTLQVRYGTAPDTSVNRMQRLPERSLLAVWEGLVGLAGGDHGVGILLALHADNAAFGVVGEAIFQSPTLLEAYLRIARYSRLVHQGVTIGLDTSSRIVGLNYGTAETGRGQLTGARAAGMLWAMGNLALVPQRSFASILQPQAAGFSCPPPADEKSAEAVFGPNISFNAAAPRLVYAKPDVEAVVRPAETRVLAYLDALATHDLDDLPPVHDIIALVKYELRRGLIGGAPTIENVASSLALSLRTLQRRLAKAGASFALILDEVRKVRARELIENDGLPMCEVAYMLGYSSQAAFSRSSRRWFGVAPSKMCRAD